MDKGIIENGKEINVRLESFISEIDVQSDYKQLDLELPAWIFIMLERKGFFDRDFLIVLAKSYCDAEFLKGVITLENKKEIEKMHRILADVEEKIDEEVKTHPIPLSENHDESSINDEKTDLEHQKYDMDRIVEFLECMKSNIDKAIKRIKYWYGDPL